MYRTLSQGFSPENEAIIREVEQFVMQMLVITWVVTIALMVIIFIIKGVSLFMLMREKDLPNPWLAFVPIAQTYIESCIVSDSIDFDGNGELLCKATFLALATFPAWGNLLTFFAPTLEKPVMAISLVLFCFVFMMKAKTMRMAGKSSLATFLILFFLEPFWLLFLRNKRR